MELLRNGQKMSRLTECNLKKLEKLDSFFFKLQQRTELCYSWTCKMQLENLKKDK